MCHYSDLGSAFGGLKQIPFLHNQPEALLGSDASSKWNLYTCTSEVILQEASGDITKRLAVFSGLQVSSLNECRLRCLNPLKLP